jgi:beta-lactamase regulating signal transducer with metallopeptidase domain/protocatechuate 3,4-dioxygenase beta subunit/peroxiredoxin
VNLATGIPWTTTALAFGLDLAAKATVLLALGLIASLAAGRRRAALGSAVGHACLLGLHLLPCSALVLPPLGFACLPAAASPSGLTVPPPSLPASGTPGDSDRAVEFPNNQPIRDLAKTGSKAGAKPISAAPLQPPLPSPTEVAAPAVAAEVPPARPTDWIALGLAAYAVVATALLVRVLTSLLAVERLRRSSVPVDDLAWSAALELCRSRLGISGHLNLAWSPRVSIPIVLGWLRPTVLLPDSLTSLDPVEHADAILMHELSHVRRGDYPWNVALRIAQSLYWPHPLIWLLGRAIAETRERVCDDVCVHELGDASSYGETLLAVAAGISRRPGPAVGLAMARPSGLARRLARIARCRGDGHCLPGRPVRILIAAIAVAAAGLLGAARLTRAGSTVPNPPPAPARLLDEPVDQPAAPAREDGGRVFHLQVVAADTGRPVPDADVRVWIALRDEWRKTDTNGRLDIVYSTGPADRHFSVDAWGDGRAMQRHNWGGDPQKPIPDGDTIKLQPGESLGGVVQDEDGRPIRGAIVYLWSHNYKKKDPHELLFDLRAISGPNGRWRTSGAPETTGELLGFHVVHADYLSSRDYTTKEIIPKIADLRAGKAVTVMKKGVPIEGRVVDAEGRPVAGALVLSSDRRYDLYTEVDEFAVNTDDNGHFRTGQVSAGDWYLLARAKGHAPGEASVRIGKAVPQVQIALERPCTFQGRVLDPAGRPVPGAFVNIDTWRGYRFLGVFLYSDADGCFRWDDAPDDVLTINVDSRGYTGLSRQQVRPTDQVARFTLNPSLAVFGRVRDVETDKRVESATVEFGAIDPKTGDVSSWSGLPRDQVGVHQGDLNADFPVEAESYKLRVTADGYLPFISRVFRRDETVVSNYDIKLVPGKTSGPTATVLRPDGKPLAGARVYSTQLNEGLNVGDGVVRSPRSSGREILTGPDGTFPIPTYNKPFLVLIVGDDVYAYAGQKALTDSRKVQARPYGRIEGRYFVGSRAIPNQPLELSGLLQDESTMFCNLYFNEEATTDAEGRFAFEKVIPLPHLRVARRNRSDAAGSVWSLGEPVHVTPGETTRVTVGGKGRPVIGRIAPPDGWTQPVDFTDRGSASIESNRPFTPYPPESFRGKTTLNDPFWSEWSDRWRKTPEGIAYLDSRVAIHVGLAPDGSFRFDDLPAGEYRLEIRVNDQRTGRDRGPFAPILREFTVPPIAGVRRLDPLDLGTIRLMPRIVLKAGDPAPDFDFTTVDGKTARLKDYRGKYLLLNFGVMWDDQCRLQIARLNDIHERFGEDERFAILSLVMETDNARTRAFVAAKGEPWPQAIVGPLTNPIASAYGIENSVPAAILIGPDGKVIARDLWYNQIGEAIGKALGKAGN